MLGELYLVIRKMKCKKYHNIKTLKKQLFVMLVTTFLLSTILLPSTISQQEKTDGQILFDPVPLDDDIIPLDTDFIYEIVEYLSNIVMQKDSSGKTLYPKSRCFGTLGELLAKEYLVNMWKTHISQDIIEEPVIHPYDDKYEPVSYWFTLYNETDTLNVPESNCFPYVQKIKENVIHSFEHVQVKLPPDNWFETHVIELAIKSFNAPLNFKTQDLVSEVTQIKNINDILENQINEKVQLIDTTSIKDTELESLIEDIDQFKSAGLILATDEFSNIHSNAINLPVIEISKSDFVILDEILNNEKEVFIDIADAITVNSIEKNLMIHFGSQDEFNSLLLGSGDDAELYLISQDNAYNKYIYQRLENYQDETNIKVGFIMYDVNDHTHFMHPTKHNIPGISINGSTGKWIKNQLLNNLEVTASYFLNQKFIESVESYTIIGTVMQGSEDDLVIVEGHYDSMWGQFSSDNAVGIAVTFGIAKFYADNADKIEPKYNLKFIGFAGEEQGLLGSSSYIDSNWDELTSKPIRCVLNLDTFANTLDDVPFAIRYYSGLGGIPGWKLNNDIQGIFSDNNYDMVCGNSDGHIVVSWLSSIGNIGLFLGGRSDGGQFLKKLPSGNKPQHLLLIDKFDVEDPTKNQPIYQRSGEEYTAGDSMSVINFDDLCASSEVILAITRYFAGDQYTNNQEQTSSEIEASAMETLLSSDNNFLQDFVEQSLSQ